MRTPQFRKVTLDNGVTVVGEVHQGFHAVSVGVWVMVGSGNESLRNNGITHAIEHMVFKGTARRSSFEIATALESLGGDLNAFTDREATCFHATVLSEHISHAIDILSDLVLHPTFDRAQMDR